MHDCLNDQPARTVCKVAQSEIYACLADARARAARLIQPARRAPLNAGIKSFPTRDRRPSETEIQIAQKSPNMHSQKMGAGCSLYRYSVPAVHLRCICNQSAKKLSMVRRRQ